MQELSLFSGAGGGILGGMLLGWETVCAVENDHHARNVLIARQNDGTFNPFPIWDDVCSFNGTEWKGRIDVISGGFPCQDVSTAGKEVGITGKRSGLWKEMARIVGEVQPRYVFIENSPMLRTRGLSTILKDLAENGYDAKWGMFRASDFGARHKRERIFILAYSMFYGLSSVEKQRSDDTNILNTKEREKIAMQFKGSNPPGLFPGKSSKCGDVRESKKWWSVEPGMGRMVDGMAYRNDRIKRLGNGQIPEMVRTAWNELIK